MSVCIFFVEVAPLFSETDAEKKETLKQSLLTETIPFYAERFEKRINENNGYLAANKVQTLLFHKDIE